MAVLDVALMGKPVLRQKAQLVPEDQIKTKETQQFIDDMLETVKQEPEEGFTYVGLAAPQVFQSQRIFVAYVPIGDVPKPQFEIFINPELEITTDQMKTGHESCISTPNLGGMVPRYTEVQIKYIDREGNKKRQKFSNEYAIYVQHEFDHLEGILWIDKVTDTKTIGYC